MRPSEQNFEKTLFGDVPLPEKVVNVASVPHRSPFRYPGGKTWLVPRIRQQGEHRERHRVLPFRAVHGDDQYVVVTFDVDLGHLRRFAPIMELVPHVSTLWPLSWGG